jgi:hypothetical protein
MIYILTRNSHKFKSSHLYAQIIFGGFIPNSRFNRSIKINRDLTKTKHWRARSKQIWADPGEAGPLCAVTRQLLKKGQLL